MTARPDDELDELIHRVDLDGLVRLVDARCDTRDWDGLRRVRDRARSAASTGRQLWPAATLAEYRLALLAPAPWAAAVLDDAGRFTIGPLSEVIAQHHTWADLAPHLPPTPSSVYVAHERALRGELVDDDDLERFPPVIDIPVTIRSWEPRYPVAVYHDSHAEFPDPARPAPSSAAPVELARGAGPIVGVDGDAFDEAVRHLLAGWTAGSDGFAATSCVGGDAAAAVGALGVHAARFTEIAADHALAWLGWAGASGGAHGRRRGAAAGRDGAWWVLGALGDLHDDWPPSDARVAELLDDLRWWWWDDGGPDRGWTLQLAVDDRSSGTAWAIAAGDTGDTSHTGGERRAG